MVDDDALSWLEVIRASIREIASADYAPEVIDVWAPKISEKEVQPVVRTVEAGLSDARLKRKALADGREGANQN
jgi:hypothetical protein